MFINTSTKLVAVLAIIIQKQILIKAADECDANTECKPIKNCPRILHNFHGMTYKPYCNLNQPGTFVCCSKTEQNYYTQDKDEGIRAVRECRSYNNLRPKCQKSLIVGGKKADPKEFPFMALIYYKESTDTEPNWLCGGTLISSKFVMTAAHCFYVTSPPNWVRLGELDHSTNNDDASPVDYPIKGKFIRSDYYNTDVQTKYNDIALVELNAAVTFNDYIMPACLPLVDGTDFPQFQSAGWGQITDTNFDKPSHLLKVTLDRFNDSDCHRLIRKTETLPNGFKKPTQICAGSFSDTRDTCLGDSGGPLFVAHPDFKCVFLVLGIVSYGEGGCGNQGYPAVYTRVQLYLDWIERIVWNEGVSLQK